MAKLMIDLDGATRRRLERHRERLGFRSLADVIRHWISGPIVDRDDVQDAGDVLIDYSPSIGDEDVAVEPDQPVKRPATKPRDFARNAIVTVTNRDAVPTRLQGVEVGAGETVHFGPVKAEPGSRLKGKGK